MKKLITLILSICCIYNANGTHVVSGELTYQHISENDYTVVLTLFRDCSEASMSSTATASFNSSCGNFNQSLPQVAFSQINPQCTVQLTTCNGGAAFGMQMYIYSDTVTLNPCADWVISYNLCCRNTSNTLIGQQNLYIDAQLNNTIFSNSSPVFTHELVVKFYGSNYICINNTAWDTDGDSLIYSMVAAKQNATTPIAYNTGYSPSNPFNSSPLNFNPANGNICTTPTLLGGFVYVIQVDEYHNGQFKISDFFLYF